MVTIMTLLVVSAVFAILGGLAFTEVRSLQYKLQEKTLQYDKAIDAIDVYRARCENHNKQIEFHRNASACADDVIGTYSKLDTLHRERIAELTKEIDDYKQHVKLAHDYCDRQTEELKVLRVKVLTLSKELQSIKDSLPDWAGGTDIDE